MSMTDSIKSAGTIVVTALIFVFVAMWSLAVWKNLGKAPVYLADGKTVEVDEFLRAKDIFVLVLPLLTTTVGYWLGSLVSAATGSLWPPPATRSGRCPAPARCPGIRCCVGHHRLVTS